MVSSRICLQCGRPRFDLWVGKILWRRKWQPTSVLSGESPWTEEPGGLQSTGVAQSQTRLKLLTHRVRAATSFVFTQANQGCMVLALLTPQLFPQEWSTAETNGGEFI